MDALPRFDDGKRDIIYRMSFCRSGIHKRRQPQFRCLRSWIAGGLWWWMQWYCLIASQHENDWWHGWPVLRMLLNAEQTDTEAFPSFVHRIRVPQKWIHEFSYSVLIPSLPCLINAIHFRALSHLIYTYICIARRKRQELDGNKGLEGDYSFDKSLPVMLNIRCSIPLST